jgi:electron transport complex protein RnfG
MMRDILNFSLRLMLVCAIAAAGLGLTYGAVKSNIAKMDKQEREDGARDVLAPAGLTAVEVTPDNQAQYGIDLDSLKGQFPDLQGVFVGLDESGQPAGYAFVLQTKGYNFMTMAVGIDSQGKIISVKVIKQEETPGIGSTVADSEEYLSQYQGRGPDPLKLGEGVDARTGATFTSNGINNGVNLALEAYSAMQEGK